METIQHAIKRDGIALARVPSRFLMDVTRYGARDPVGMIKFRLNCLPDMQSWRVKEVCVLAVLHRLDSRIRLAGEVSINDPELHSENEVTLVDKSLTLARFYAAEKNIFRDIMQTLFRRFYSSLAELKVSFAFLINLERRPV
jgi:hypothetical protein